jgi:hypothetical protein
MYSPSLFLINSGKGPVGFRAIQPAAYLHEFTLPPHATAVTEKTGNVTIQKHRFTMSPLSIVYYQTQSPTLAYDAFSS